MVTTRVVVLLGVMGPLVPNSMPVVDVEDVGYMMGTAVGGGGRGGLGPWGAVDIEEALDTEETLDIEEALDTLDVLDSLDALGTSCESGLITTPDWVHGRPSRGHSSMLCRPAAELGRMGVDVLKEIEVRTARMVRRSVIVSISM